MTPEQRFLYAVSNSVLELTDEEVLAETIENGEEPERIAQMVSDIFKMSIEHVLAGKNQHSCIYDDLG